MAQFDDELIALTGNKPSTSSSPLITSEANLFNAEGEQTLVKPYRPVQATRSVEDPLKGLMSNLSAQMMSVGQEPDPMKRMESLTAFRGAVASTFADVSGKARQMAEAQVGVPLLMKKVKEAEMLDRADPLYGQHLADSKDTQMVKQQLAVAQEKAGQLGKQYLAENPLVAGMASQVDSFLKLQDSLLAKDINRQDIQQQKADELMSMISPETANDIWTIRPDLKGNTNATAKFMEQELKLNKKDWEPILSGALKPEDLLMQGLTGNRVAAALAVKKQAEATGLPEATVLKQAKVLNDFVNNPATADKMIKDFNLLPTEKDQKAYMAIGLAGGKQGQVEQAKIRLSMVEDLASKIAVGAINNNVDKWPVEPGKLGLMNIPEAGPIVQDFQKTTGRTPNIQEFYNAFVNSAEIPPEERVQRSEMVKASYSEMLKKASQGIYGTSIDIVGLTNKLAVRGAMGNNSQRTGHLRETLGDNNGQ